MTLRDFASRRLGLVPSTVTEPALRSFLQRIADEINTVPTISTFSFSTPESNVTASAPTIGVNLASSHTRLWLKETGAGNTGWVSLVTA